MAPQTALNFALLGVALLWGAAASPVGYSFASGNAGVIASG